MSSHADRLPDIEILFISTTTWPPLKPRGALTMNAIRPDRAGPGRRSM